MSMRAHRPRIFLRSTDGKGTYDGRERPGGHPAGSVGWVWQEWLTVGAVGTIAMDKRCVSIELTTPKIGRILWTFVYGWADDHVRTLGLFDIFIKHASKLSLPWALIGDSNIGAGDMAWGR